MSVLVISGAEGRPTTPQAALPDPVTIEHGGTNSTTALNNHRVMGSVSGAIAELAAGTAGQVLTSGGAGVVPSWQSPSGGGISATDYFFSPVDYARNSLSGSIGGGTWTLGTKFYLTKTCTITKIRFAYPTSGTPDVKLTLWDEVGTQLATVTVTVAGAGVYEGAISYVIDSTKLGKPFTVGMILVAGGYTAYPYGTGGRAPPTGPFIAGPSIVFTRHNLQVNSDAWPSDGSAGEWSPVEPVLQ